MGFLCWQARVADCRSSVGPGGICLAANSSAAEWADAFSSLWDEDATYQNASAAATEFSWRPEIQPNFLVEALIALIQAHAAAKFNPTDAQLYERADRI